MDIAPSHPAARSPSRWRPWLALAAIGALHLAPWGAYWWIDWRGRLDGQSWASIELGYFALAQAQTSLAAAVAAWGAWRASDRWLLGFLLLVGVLLSCGGWLLLLPRGSFSPFSLSQAILFHVLPVQWLLLSAILQAARWRVGFAWRWRDEPLPDRRLQLRDLLVWTALVALLLALLRVAGLLTLESWQEYDSSFNLLLASLAFTATLTGLLLLAPYAWFRPPFIRWLAFVAGIPVAVALDRTLVNLVMEFGATLNESLVLVGFHALVLAMTLAALSAAGWRLGRGPSDVTEAG